VQKAVNGGTLSGLCYKTFYGCNYWLLQQ